jgi:SAM-dependent methyltransferase
VKICPACSARIGDVWECSGCGWQAPLVDGYFALAPDLARANDGFDPAHFTELADVEAGNFWFRARNHLIAWALRRYFPSASNLLEVGCGTGFVLSSIKARFPEIELSGSEIYCAGLGIAQRRAHGAALFQMDARAVPFVSEFDVIGAFDVLEHIGDDELVLRQLHRALRPNGGILITVPQHQFLWSPVDEAAHHVRRYARSELEAKVRKAGFQVIKVTSFVTLLLPVMMLSRMLKRLPKANDDPIAELRTGGRLVNLVLGLVMSVERMFIRLGITLPFGGSLLLVARK